MRWFEKIAASRPPDFYVGSAEDPYLQRWWVIPRNRWLNIYLHHFLRSDTDEALHDHPWANVSILLAGSYTECTIAAGGVMHCQVMEQGSIKFRWPSGAHRVELHRGDCWSLFITGPVVREWGFHCTKGWKPWREFLKLARERGPGQGCD